ncbi:hypothetical protein TeGR_g6593 [Tetraparma gracilis]|uniref:PX domain-containing protein n=1 Tax=Tetraparma gracilis TaxID=2962635 RepID=A0ABQ6N8D4_9STRA|nr:hypothetical protein TeGR_g6593 [Tetraparma gracilis]
MSAPNPFASAPSKSLRDEAFQRRASLQAARSPSSPAPPGGAQPATSQPAASLASSAVLPPPAPARAQPERLSQSYASIPSNSYFASPPPSSPPSNPSSNPSSHPSSNPSSAAPQVQESPKHPPAAASLIASAREEWSSRGETSAGQPLEDRRRELSSKVKDAQPIAGSQMLNTVLLQSAAALPPRPPASVFSPKVLSPSPRVDPAGSPYTTYLISVHSPGAPPATIEHRFSEFLSLHSLLLSLSSSPPAPFPRKSPAGRLGNWTPSALLFPDAAAKLVQERAVQLDAWLLSACETLADGSMESARARDAVREFLSVSAAGRPPCERENPVDWVGLAVNQKERGSSSSPGEPGRSQPQMYLGNPVSFTMGGEVRKATFTIANMCGVSHLSNDRSVPLDLMRQAKGIAFLTVAKGGVILTGRIGTGLVVGRLPDGSWSAPSAIGTIGVGWGAQIGGDITSYLIILNSDSALKSFSGQAQLSVGAELDVAVGPVGRSAKGNAAAGGGEFLAPAYSYSHSKGLFVGISLEGAVITARNDVNARFYGRPIDARTLLSGGVERPRAAGILYDALGEALSVQIDGWRPSVAMQQAGLVRGEPMQAVAAGGVMHPAVVGGGGMANPYGGGAS